MPQTTTKLPTGTEQPRPGAPRVEIPVTETTPPPPRPTRRSVPTDDGADERAPVLIDERAPAMEPWLWVLIASLAPAVIALFVPHAARPALLVAAVALVFAGLVMLFVHEWRHARGRSRVADQAS